jgi:hypothetical protein
LFDFELSRTGTNPARNAATTSDCLRVHASTAITVNGTAAQMNSQGSFDDGDAGFETNCNDPYFTAQLPSGPAQVDITISDSSETLVIGLVQQANGSYSVTRCDAASCTMFQNIACKTSSSGVCPI